MSVYINEKTWPVWESSSPMQLGPQSLMPWLFARATHSSCIFLPSGPASAKPADSMMMPFTFFFSAFLDGFEKGGGRDEVYGQVEVSRD